MGIAFMTALSPATDMPKSSFLRFSPLLAAGIAPSSRAPLQVQLVHNDCCFRTIAAAAASLAASL